MSGAPISVLHVISGLRTGGAEMMLLKLLRESPAHGMNARVLSLSGAGTVGRAISEAGVEVTTVEDGAMRGARALGAITKTVSSFRPHVVQAWMYHANVLTTVSSMIGRWKAPVVWNIRASLEKGSMDRASTKMAVKAGAMLSRRPARIIYNSGVGARNHEEIGYDRSRSLLIPNGFDVERFKADARLRADMRRELGLEADVVAVGHVGRYHPMKDHQTFLRAFAQAATNVPRMKAVLVGAGVTNGNADLRDAIVDLGLSGKCLLLGERSDIAQLMNCFDIFVSSSSKYEGFSNVLGEAMASAVPCVCTDVGDAASIMGETGYLVRPGEADAIAAAIRQLATDSDRRRTLGASGRERIEQRYSIARVAEQYAALYRECVQA